MTGSTAALSHARSAAGSPASRRLYLDWLRGVAVLIMIEAHTLDAWTRPDDRHSWLYGWSVMLGGMGAPLFLFLAGVAVVFAAASRERTLGTAPAAAASVRRRGWQVFGYAFLFRLQSFVLSPGAPAWSLLKVDILNIMGPAIVAAAALWQWGRSLAGRIAALAAATVAIAMLTPIVRITPWLSWLPNPVEWYFRPEPGRANFTLFPWAAFVTAGALVALFLQRARDPVAERRAVGLVGVAGAIVAAGAYYASFQPSIYASSQFWTSSPTFFFIRLGLMCAAIPLAWAWQQRPWSRGAGPLVLFGVESLFVYWIHVEMVYGVLSHPIRRQLTFPQAVAGFALFTLLMFGAVLLKRHLADWWRQRRQAAPVMRQNG